MHSLRRGQARPAWDFKGITLKAYIACVTDAHTFVDVNGTSVPPNSRSNQPALAYLHDSQTRIHAPQIPVTAFVPPPLAAETDDSSSDSDEVDAEPHSGDALKQADEIARARLIQHLNARRDYHNRVIALAMDANTRWVLLERAVGPVVARSLGPEPVGAIGYYVAFVYNDELPEDIEYSEDDHRPKNRSSRCRHVGCSRRLSWVSAMLASRGTSHGCGTGPRPRSNRSRI